MNNHSLAFRQLFATLFMLFVGFFAAAALQAWTGPTAAAPNGNVAAPINTGTTDQVKNAGLSLNALTVFGSQYIQSKLGIGRVSPVVALDVNGTIRIGNGAEVCQAISEGGVRYNSTSKVLEYCDGTSWKAFSTALQPQVSTYDTPGTYTWTKPSAGSMALIECWGGGGGGAGWNWFGNTGGGGGGYVTKTMTLGSLPATVTVTVGAGGAGGPPSGSAGGLGTSGGNSSFGTYATAYGGGSGSLQPDGNNSYYIATATGGSYSGGSGENGGSGNGTSTSCAGAGGNGVSSAAHGGTSGCGGNGGREGSPSSVNGANGSASGGGGGGYYPGSSGANGGAGAAGKCVVTVS